MGTLGEHLEDMMQGTKEDIEIFYDLVVVVNCFEDIWTTGWEIKTDLKRTEELVQDGAIRVSIMGDSKKGKTWLLERLIERSRPVFGASKTARTPGLCWKRAPILGVPYILMDPKGEDNLVSSCSPHSINDRRAEERLLRDIQCNMSDVFIFLVNSIGLREQKALHSLCIRLARTKTYSRVVVVHNLHDTIQKKDYDAAAEEIKTLYQGEGFEPQDQPIECLGEIRNIKSFKTAAAVPQIHFFLGRDGKESGYMNSWVVEAIKQQLLLFQQQFVCVGAKARNGTLMSQLEAVIKESLPQYLRSTESIAAAKLEILKRTTDEGTVMMTIGGLPKDVKVCSFGMDEWNYVPTIPIACGSRSGIGESWRISEISALNSTEGKRLKVEIKLPGYSAVQLDEDLNSNLEDHEFRRRYPPVIELVSNSHFDCHFVGYTIKVCPSSIKNTRPLESVYRETFGYDPVCHEVFPIEIRQRVKLREASYEQGIVILVFSKEEHSITCVFPNRDEAMETSEGDDRHRWVVPYGENWHDMFEEKMASAQQHGARVKNVVVFDNRDRNLGLVWSDRGKPELGTVPDPDAFPIIIRLQASN